MIEAVIFDFDSTLVDYPYNDEYAIARLLKLVPGKIDRQLFFKKSVEIIVKAYEQGNICGTELHRWRLQNTMEHFGIEWRDDYLKHFLDAYLSEIPVYEGVFSLLEMLRDKVKLGILTNAMDPFEQRERIKKAGLEEYFHTISIGHEIGIYKPDKEAFLITARSLNASAKNCIFIGDSEYYDIEGAKKAGMITAKKIYNGNDNTVADMFFSDYDEFCTILSKNYFS